MGLIEAPLALSFCLATLLELLPGRSPDGRKKNRPRPRPWPRPVLAIGMLLTLAVSAIGSFPGAGPELLAVLAGAMILFAGALPSDLTVSKSRRHFWATIFASIPLLLAGVWVDHFGVPGLGKIDIPAAPGVVFTLIWIFGIVGIIEVCSLFPYLTSIVALLVCSTLILPVDINRTPAGIIVAGALAGVLLGRFAGQLLRGRGRPPEKSETLLLGYFLAFLTLTLFLKAVTLAGLILPLTLIILLIAVVALQSFDRSLILRPWPRD